MPFDAVLPSYEDAVATSGSWVSLAAPYVSTADYPSLCLVSRRFNDVFTPLLWRDPLVTIRKLGLDPADGSLHRPLSSQIPSCRKLPTSFPHPYYSFSRARSRIPYFQI